MNSSARFEKRSVLAASLLLALLGSGSLAMAKGVKDDAPANPNAAVAKAMGGKVWVFADPVPAAEGEALRAQLAAHKPGARIAQKDKDGPWTAHLLAVFKKPATPGPVTVQFFEKGDLVDQISLDNEEATLVFRGSVACEPDKGFNKAHKYSIKVGQILKDKFVSHAAGELTLE